MKAIEAETGIHDDKEDNAETGTAESDHDDEVKGAEDIKNMKAMHSQKASKKSKKMLEAEATV